MAPATKPCNSSFLFISLPIVAAEQLLLAIVLLLPPANILGPGDVPLQDTQPPLPDQGLFLQVIPGFRLVTAQELFSKCVYLGFEIPHGQVSI